MTIVDDDAIRRAAAIGAKSSPNDAGSVVAARYRGEIVYRDAFDRIREPWRRLANTAIEDNPFFSPDILEPAIVSIAPRDVCLVIVWDRDAGERLAAVMPLVAGGRFGPLPGPAIAWRHPYSMSGTPLIDPENPIAALSALLRTVRANPRVSNTLFLPFLHADGPFYPLLIAACRELRFTLHATSGHKRATLKSDVDGESYLRNSVGTKRLKEYRRLTRRLGDTHDVSFTTHREIDDVDTAFAEFLDLELSSWKGRSGTAIGALEEDEMFFRTALARLSRSGSARIDALRVDGAAIAQIVGFHVNGNYRSWKIAHDEELSRFSPGVLLMLELTRSLCDDPKIIGADSLADPNHPMIDHIWRERIEMRDVMIALGSALAPGFLGYRFLELARVIAKENLSGIRKKIRSIRVARGG